MSKACKKCDAVKPLSDFPKAKGCLDGTRHSCKACMALKTKVWKESDPERARASIKACKENNPARWYEKERIRTKRYKKNNPEKVREANKKYAEENPHVGRRHYEDNREKIIARSAEWAKKNPERSAVLSLAAANKRRARKLQATPAWADMDAITWIYEMRQKICALTGEEWEVDHVIPLKGKLVCGLHVPENMQIIEKVANRMKAARFDPETAHV